MKQMFRLVADAIARVPHNWQSRVLLEETTGTLFCGELFTQTGDGADASNSLAHADKATYRMTRLSHHDAASNLARVGL